LEGKKQRLIFHVDMDSFYASCELAKNPELKDSPFVVGADPKEGKGRGVVLACNYPARKFGIRSGMPISRAWKLCPDAKYVYPDHRLYGEVSRRIMKILRAINEKVEQVSIDEAYLDFSEDPSVASLNGSQRNEGIRSIAGEIKKRIKEQENITCSIGVSNSKVISKIATDVQKPDGLTIVDPEKVKDFLGPLAVSRIPGVGKVTERILVEKFKVKTIDDLAKVPLDTLRDAFGKSAIWLRNVANGVEESRVVTDWEPVSQSGETTFDEDEEDYEKVAKVMREVAEDVHKRVSKDGYSFRGIGIKIRFSGFETHTRSKTLSTPTDSLEAVIRETERQLAEFATSGKRVRLIGVRLSSLEQKNEGGQHTLSEWG
jgi:DNA polymerase IV (archaeal DinB-like DNA polymerase)